MTISFNQIPVDIMVPGTYVEFDNSRAVRPLGAQPYRLLALGQRLGPGTVAADTLVQVGSVEKAAEYFGRGSMLHQMVAAMKRVNAYTDLWAIGCDDDGAGVAATGKVTITGTATAAGTLTVYVAGVRVRIAVASGDAEADICTALVAAIQAQPDLVATAAVNGGNDNECDLTARHKGLVGNDIDVRTGYYTTDTIPAGLAVAITAMSGGTGNPDITGALAAAGDNWFNLIALPYTDGANLALVETELADRWGPLRPIEGHAVCAAAGTQAAMTTLGNGRNSPHVSIFGTNASPTVPWEYAAACAAVLAFEGQQDPARQFTTVPLYGILPPNVNDRWTFNERDVLLHDGISTTTVDNGGTVRMERVITTYQTNSQAMLDTSYRELTTMLTLGYLRWSFRNLWTNKFARHKLADDGTQFGIGQKVMTPKIAKAECLSIFRGWEENGLVEGVDQFKADLVVQRNNGDPNRLDILLPPDLINQLRVTAAQIQFLQ